MALTNAQKTAILQSYPLLRAFRVNLPALKVWLQQVESITSNDVLGQAFADIAAQIAIGDEDASEAAFNSASLSLYDLNTLGNQSAAIMGGIGTFITNYQTLYAAMDVPEPVTIPPEQPE
jgi:hypothetical protein